MLNFQKIVRFMKHLVIGLGQIGSAIREILGPSSSDGLDIEEPLLGQYDVIHVCIPYSENFIEIVSDYQKMFDPHLTIIHSTVALGTSERLGAVHSPVRGIHPHLVLGIRTFVKVFGGEKAEEAAKIFEDLGVETMITRSSRDTEAMKLWDTTIYGWNIVLEKIIHEYCEKNDLDFNIVYTEANRTYNLGYQELDRPEYAKYVLKHVPGPVGGHCVIPNLEMLGGPIADFIKNYNQQLLEKEASKKTESV